MSAVGGQKKQTIIAMSVDCSRWSQNKWPNQTYDYSISAVGSYKKVCAKTYKYTINII